MTLPLSSLALLFLSATAVADRGFPTTTRGDSDPGTAPNPDAESHAIVDLTPSGWSPQTGDALVEGWVELICIQEDLLMNGTQGRTRGIASVQPIDPATWGPAGDWVSPKICTQWQDGTVQCELYLLPGLWRFRCETDLPDGVMDVDPSNDVVEELLWVAPAG